MYTYTLTGFPFIWSRNTLVFAQNVLFMCVKLVSVHCIRGKLKFLSLWFNFNEKSWSWFFNGCFFVLWLSHLFNCNNQIAPTANSLWTCELLLKTQVRFTAMSAWSKFYIFFREFIAYVSEFLFFFLFLINGRQFMFSWVNAIKAM